MNLPRTRTYFQQEIDSRLVVTRQMSMPPIDKWSSIRQIYMEVCELSCPKPKRKKNCKKKKVVFCPPKRKKHLKRKCPSKRNCCCKKIVVREQIVNVTIPPGALGTAGAVGTAGSVGAAGTVGAAGSVGTAGSVGSVGTAGSVGAAGTVGPAGTVGTAGSVGAAGTVGVAGAVGATGATGATGAAGGGLSQFGYVYNLTGNVVPIEADVVFDTNGFLTPGITHAPGTSQIAVTDAGNYEVTFSVSGSEPNQFALFLNGALVPGTIYASGAGTQQNTGQAIFPIGSGGVITLRNHSSSSAVTLATPIGGTQASVNASVVIKRLS
jgi:hypothetical protein